MEFRLERHFTHETTPVFKYPDKNTSFLSHGLYVIFINVSI